MGSGDTGSDITLTDRVNDVRVWLWHSFSDLVQRVVDGADVASVIMCAVRS